MNKNRLLYAAFLVIAVVMLYCGYALLCTRSCEGKVWLHRCNSLEKLGEKGGKYAGFEVDVCMRPDGTLDVTHEERISFGLPVDTFFAYLEQHPGVGMWLDVKNLSASNQSLFVQVLDSLCYAHDVRPERLVVESREWELLRPLTRQGYLTSCYVGLEENDSAVAYLQRVADSGAVRALSFPRKWYGKMKRSLNRRNIALLTWCNHQTLGQLRLRLQGQRMLRDPQLRVILIKDHGSYHR